MKYLFLLFPFQLLSQNVDLVTCPLTVGFPKDTTTEVWGLISSGNTPWQLIGNFQPYPNSKEGYVYEPWTALNPQPPAPVGIFVSVAATQNRTNPTQGTVEMQTLYCVYNKRGTTSNQSNQANKK